MAKIKRNHFITKRKLLGPKKPHYFKWEGAWWVIDKISVTMLEWWGNSDVTAKPSYSKFDLNAGGSVSLDLMQMLIESNSRTRFGPKLTSSR